MDLMWEEGNQRNQETSYVCYYKQMVGDSAVYLDGKRWEGEVCKEKPFLMLPSRPKFTETQRGQ